ncbi:MAG: hypothetical protein Tsb005_00030 [Gammaproteobacteria bacterium]
MFSSWFLSKEEKQQKVDELKQQAEKLERDQPLEALQKYNEALYFTKKDPAIWFAKAEIYSKNIRNNKLLTKNNYEKVIHWYETAVELDVKFKIKCQIGKSRVLEQVKRMQQVEQCLQVIENIKNHHKDPQPEQSSEQTKLFNHLIQEIESLHDARNWQELLEVSSAALKIKDNNARLWCLKANALFHLRQYATALVNIETAINLNVKNADFYYYKAKILFKLKKYQEALISCDEALSLGKQEKSLLLGKQGDAIWNIKARITSALKQYEVALYCYSQAIKCSENAKMKYWYNKAQIFNKLKNSHEALLCYQQALAMTPKNYKEKEIKDNVLKEQAKLQDQQRHEKVKSVRPQAIQKPAKIENHVLPAALIQNSQKNSEDKSEDKSDGSVLKKNSKSKITEFATNEAVTLKDDLFESFVQKAQALYEKQNWQELLTACSAGLKLEDKNAWLWSLKANGLFHLEQYKDALKHIEMAIQLDTKNANFYDIKAQILYKLDNYQEALECCQHCLLANMKDAAMWDFKGQIEHKLEKYQLALKSYDKAIKLNINAMSYWYNKAQTLNELKQYDEALRCCQQILSMSPKNDQEKHIQAKVSTLKIQLNKLQEEETKRALVTQEKYDVNQIALANHKAETVADARAAKDSCELLLKQSNERVLGYLRKSAEILHDYAHLDQADPENVTSVIRHPENRKSITAMHVDFNIAYSTFSLGDKLGQGGFGVVYKGLWLGHEVAVKQLHLDKLSKKAGDEFIEEASIMAQLRHPSIVTFYGYCAEPYCLVMEHMVKGALYYTLHNNQQALSWELRHQWAVQIAKGLWYLHTKGIVHRDVKSLNVLLNQFYEVKLGDFGLARAKQETSVSSSNKHLQAPKKVGTIKWQAPEVMDGEKASSKSDMFSYGVTLWEIAARENPWKDIHEDMVIIRLVADKQKREEIPADCKQQAPKLAHLIQWCQKPNLTDRPSAEQVVEYLESASNADTQAATNPNNSGNTDNTSDDYRNNLYSLTS